VTTAIVRIAAQSTPARGELKICLPPTVNVKSVRQTVGSFKLSQ
jgi:hypothetical protein